MGKLQALSFDVDGRLAGTGWDGHRPPFRRACSATGLATIVTADDHTPQSEYGRGASLLQRLWP